MEKPIGSRLVELRERGGLTQAETEQLSGLCSGHVWQIERGDGRSGVKTETAIRIARLFGASVEYVALGEGDAPTDEQIKSAVSAARARSASTDGDSAA